MKKKLADATTIIGPVPGDIDLTIVVDGPGQVTLQINEDKAFHVLANLDIILATINSRLKGLIQQYLVSQAIRENELITARKKQEEQGLFDGTEKDTVKRRKS